MLRLLVRVQCLQFVLCYCFIGPTLPRNRNEKFCHAPASVNGKMKKRNNQKDSSCCQNASGDSSFVEYRKKNTTKSKKIQMERQN